MEGEKLKVVSVFDSVQGECCEERQGSWTTFIRFFGCSLHCSFCDTKYSWDGSEGYEELTVEEIMGRVNSDYRTVTLTGGEPLEQPHKVLLHLIKMLLWKGYKVSIETNGFHSPHPFLPPSLQYTNMGLYDETKVSFVLDYKLPSSNVKVKSLMPFLNLTDNHFIKFVVSDRRDFDAAVSAVKELKGLTKARMYFSPNTHKLKPITLLNWMKNSECPRLQVNYNLQIHKYIFTGNWRQEEKRN